jgi:hypothetical protein
MIIFIYIYYYLLHKYYFRIHIFFTKQSSESSLFENTYEVEKIVAFHRVTSKKYEYLVQWKSELLDLEELPTEDAIETVMKFNNTNKRSESRATYIFNEAFEKDGFKYLITEKVISIEGAYKYKVHW